MGEECSIEIQGGARKSKLCVSSDITRFPSEAYDNVETAWEVLERACRLYGNNRCFGWRTANSGYNWINYNSFRCRAVYFGFGLVNLGITPGQQDTFIGIYGDNSIEWLVAEYGCFSQSLAIIPVSDSYGLGVMIKIIKRTELELIICIDDSKAKNILLNSREIPTVKKIIVACDITEDLKQLAAAKDIRLHSFQDVEELGKRKKFSLLLPVASTVYMVCFTSGTTGDPKGVVLTHKYFVCGAYCLLMQLENEGVFISESDVMISHLFICHILEHVLEIAMILTGGRIGFYSGDSNKLQKDIQILQPTFFPTVPLILNRIYTKVRHLQFERKSTIESFTSEKIDETSYQKDELDTEIRKEIKSMLGEKIRVILTSASLISDKVLNCFRFGLGYQVIDLYGQTECGPISMKVVEKQTAGKGGVPLPSVIIKLVDVPDLGYFACYGVGEICVKGHTTFEYYLKNPSKTAEVTDSEGWIHTGDIGKFLSDGSLKVVERLTNIFKISNGFYIMPEKIENIYSRSTYVAQVFVYGDSMQDFLVSIVVPEKRVVLPLMKEVLECDTTWSKTCKNPILKELILNDMNRLGKEVGLLDFEQARAVYLHPDLLTHPSGHLTATFKTRRVICRHIFKSEINAMYEEISVIKQ